MTDHAEISRQLALAIGYAPESVRVVSPWPPGYCEVYRITNDMGPYWREFDYRSPGVAMPVLDWLMREHEAQPGHNAHGFHIWLQADSVAVATGDTLPLAIARAAIAVGKGGV